MEYQFVLTDKGNGLATITLNSSANFNALSSGLQKELEQALCELSADESVRVICITGVGKAFIAGGDVALMKTMSPQEAMAYSETSGRLCEIIEKSPKVIVAAINGICMGGGCEIALACDLRIGVNHAKFGMPEVKLGILPGCGATQRLTRLIGPGRAKELIFTGKTINATTAYEYGFLNQVVLSEDLESTIRDIADTLTSVGPVGLSAAKDCINKCADLSVDAGLKYERQAFGLCFTTKDQWEGMTAFLEKRPAEFTGR